ncbi:MAG: hypothetical protein H0X66_20220 [Verrucomicrobia bacterium]|nr:hypothetical protein [Verrucomicrobiota bacterium]
MYFGFGIVLALASAETTRKIKNPRSVLELRATCERKPMPQVALAYYDYASYYEYTGKWFHCGAETNNRAAAGQ